MNIKKILTGGAATALLLSNIAMPAFAAPNWDLNAPRNIDFDCGGIYSHSLETVSQNPDGTFTGTGYYLADNSYTWNISGDIEGDNITFQLVYTGTNSGYTLNGNGTIAIDGSISGTTDGNCSTFTMPEDSADEIDNTPTPTPNPYAVPEECNDIEGLGAPIVGTEGSDILNGTSGQDLIFALGGSDVVNGKGGNDCIVGGDGSDALHGQGGNDVILGGNGSDAIYGHEGKDMLYGQDGSDSLKGGSGDDQMWGGKGTDSLKGDGGNDKADGGDDSDSCNAETETTCEV